MTTATIHALPAQQLDTLSFMQIAEATHAALKTSGEPIADAGQITDRQGQGPFNIAMSNGQIRNPQYRDLLFPSHDACDSEGPEHYKTTVFAEDRRVAITGSFDGDGKPRWSLTDLYTGEAYCFHPDQEFSYDLDIVIEAALQSPFQD